jgi:hypothetical protein
LPSVGDKIHHGFHSSNSTYIISHKEEYAFYDLWIKIF